MSSIIIAYPPDLVASATLTAGSYSAGAPRDNLKTEDLSQVARTSDDANASTKVTVDLGSATAVSALIAGPMNTSAAMKYRVRGAAADTFGSGYNSDWIDAGITADEVDPERGYNVIHILSAAETYRYWQLEIDDDDNPDGYIDIGRLMIPRLLKPSINYGYGDNGLVWEDRTRTLETLGGAEDKGRRRNRRVFNCGIDYLPEDEAFGSWYQFQRIVGFDRPVFVIPDPAATGAELQARSFWATVSAMDAITQATFGMAGVGLTLRERF